MLDIEKFKNEIIESIENVELQQEKTNELLLKYTEDKLEDGEKKENDDEDLELEEENEEEGQNETFDETEEDTKVSENDEENELQVLIEQNESLIQELQEMNQNQIESSWLISLTIVITLGFSYFMKQISKW